MKKKITVLTVAVVLISLCACREKGSLIGKWAMTYEGITISREFREDGTIIERNSINPALRVDGTYTADGKKISIAMTEITNEEKEKSIPCDVKWEFSYRFKDGDLLLYDLNYEYDDNEEVVYKRERE